MRIFVLTIHSKSYAPEKDPNEPLSFNIDPSLTIKRFKEKIAKQINVSPCDQFLSFEGRTLEDTHTLESYDYIKDESAIHLVVFPGVLREKYRVFVAILSHEDRREVINLDIFYYDTVLQIKQAIYERTNIPVQEQRIIFAGKELDNLRIFSNYGIQKESTVYLVIRRKQMNRPVDVPPELPKPVESNGRFCNIQ